MSILDYVSSKASRNRRICKRIKIPYTIDNLWLAGCYAFKNKEQGRTVITRYFDKKRNYVDYVVNDIVPVFRTKSGTAHYKIRSWNKYPGNDPAMFDDQREYNYKTK